VLSHITQISITDFMLIVWTMNSQGINFLSLFRQPNAQN